MNRWLALFLAFCALLPRYAGAQDSSRVADLRPGMRVRFLAPAVAPDRFLGTIHWLTSDSIALDAPDHRLVTVPRSPITTMEISLGTSRLRGASRGLMWGMPVGAGIGALLSATLRGPGAPFPVEACPCGTGADRRSAILFFTVLGGVLGGGFGAANPSERWSSVPMSTNPPGAPR